MISAINLGPTDAVILPRIINAVVRDIQRYDRVVIKNSKII